MENLLQSLDLMGYIDDTCPSPPQFLITDDGITTEVTREFMEWNKNDKVVLSFISATISSEALSSLVGKSAPNSENLLSNDVGNENFTLFHNGASLSSNNLASDHPRSIKFIEGAGNSGSIVQVPSASATVQAVASIMEKDTNETVTNGETRNIEKTENDEKREKKDETADPSTGVTLNSFQKLSSSQNAFTDLSGTGFSTSTISFELISKDRSALRTSSSSLFESKNALPSGLGLSNNGSSSLFATAGPSIVSKEQEF
ncbi:nuclear pore complex protein NUP50B-like [Rosa rugosa]|uniref:nuclear pore complex protein NUP50B-like n=1 Tax=Rosa rugosa TaxID=74645 RepID=UPI002B40C87D|nr:nuclear pore complex protein NUP50B-like [Rosa rugosa]